MSREIYGRIEIWHERWPRERERERSVRACSRHGADKLHLEVANRRPARKTDAKREEGPHKEISSWNLRAK